MNVTSFMILFPSIYEDRPVYIEKPDRNPTLRQ